jgi:ribosome-associated heat shock protein Hsp15
VPVNGRPDAGIRLDKWLWHARFFRTRTLAARAVAAGSVRVNSVRVTRPAAQVAVGDGLTLVQHGRVRVVRVLGIGTRRGPAAEAHALYADVEGGAAGAGVGAEGVEPGRSADK